MRVLVVEDNIPNQKVAKMILEDLGCLVNLVANGKECLDLMRRIPFDIIFMDIHMPEMNGYEVCEVLKKDVQTREIPIIFISALNEVKDKIDAFSAGGVDYVTKPFRIEVLLARLRALIR